ncbi:hypothetical protein EXIGLDRAFT_696533 [Exidia glandulosa HHB12029]|uniref:Uncharacterized protein n=1 Tax=Exidia glandulosa HHB12029 TaxID=1314781 RepID=A0A165FAA2_EXIGL|nr:hypothetical protein EXIGLDRAFT_696533 [Exidia glandulosa HHB12029]
MSTLALRWKRFKQRLQRCLLCQPSRADVVEAISLPSVALPALHQPPSSAAAPALPDDEEPIAFVPTSAVPATSPISSEPSHSPPLPPTEPHPPVGSTCTSDSPQPVGCDVSSELPPLSDDINQTTATASGVDLPRPTSLNEPTSVGPSSPSPTSRDHALAAIEAARQYASTLPTIKLQVDQFKPWGKAVMDALDLVQGLHPVVQGLAHVFKIALQFEMRRQDNDRRVLVVKISMIEMVDGGRLNTRLQVIVDQASRNIRECSEACEAYVGLKYFAKFLDGARWEATFADYMAHFAQRREELTFALAIRNAKAIDRVGDAVVASGEVLSHSLQMLHLLRQVHSPEERQLIRFVDERGGSQRFIQSEAAFAELQAKAEELSGSRKRADDQTTQERTAALLLDVRAAVKTDISELLRAHHDEFVRSLRNIDAAIQRELPPSYTHSLTSSADALEPETLHSSENHSVPSEKITPIPTTSTPASAEVSPAVSSGVDVRARLTPWVEQGVAISRSLQSKVPDVVSSTSPLSEYRSLAQLEKLYASISIDLSDNDIHDRLPHFPSLPSAPTLRLRVPSIALPQFNNVGIAASSAFYATVDAAKHASAGLSTPEPPFVRQRANSMPGAWSTQVEEDDCSGRRYPVQSEPRDDDSSGDATANSSLGRSYTRHGMPGKF